ncbi:phage tail tape measure protein [Enterococcus gallinarum]|uniref:phage tail tape measure protein n=1 Tax=Enterococcus gallinarum TaxID=1353 RepID=UPI001F04D718|nr:phage tail tape measure protein [Enterococcus gallinarum]
MAGATPLGNMVIKLGLDDADFGKGVANSKKQVQYLAKEMQANMKVADLAGNKLGKLGTRYDGLTQIIKAQENQVTALKKAYDGSFVDGKATDSTKRLANQLQDANGKLANYKLQLQNTAGQMARLQVETQGVTGWLKQHGDAYIKQGEKIQKFGDSVSKVGSTLTKAITLPVATGFTVATKAASDFTTQIGEIGPLLTNGQAITAEYKQQLEQMGESSKQWAKDYGVSTTEINQGLAEVVRKGYDANQTMGVMPAILDATKASGDAFNDVMNVSTEVISQFNLKGKDYETTVQNATRVTDSLTYVANATSAGFTDLGLAMSYVGPVANSLNMSVEETAAAIGLLSDAGIGGEKAGTALRGALTRLLKPSKQNIAGFDQLGISVDAFKEGTLTLPDILDKIKTNTQGWTDAQRTSAIALAFGTESQSAMNVLVNQGGDALRNLTSETESASGATKKIADSMKDLPANKVARFKESLNVLAITFGEKLLPLVTPWIEKATDMVNSFSKLDDATQNNIVKWGLMAAAAGPALKLLGGGISTIGSVTKGVGKLSTGIVELVAASAEKKALATLATSVTGVGTAASGAAGSAGVGAMTTALGASGLAGALPLIVGAGGLLAVGYGAWKLFGEEAWNSSQRVQRWGEDVTQATDTTLSAVQDHTNKASGTFNLMAQGFDTDTASMVSNFQLIGSTIENDLTNKLEAYKTAVDLLPTELQEKASQILDEKADETQKVMELVKANNEEVLRIKQQYVDKDGEITIQGAKMVQDLMTQSAKEYLNIAITDADARREVMSALTGDVETATAEQAEAWIKSLAQQRQQTKASYTEDINDYRSKLEKTGQLNKEEIDMLVGLYEDARETSTDALDAQMALLVQKYPELAEKISLANGQMIDQTAGTTEAFIAENQKILENSANLSAKLSENAKKNAKSLAWTADQTTKAGKTWNDLELLDKDGNVKTNATEIVTEATKDIQTWNDMKVLVHNANLDSNAKKVIGEAAIANGYWDGMAWSDKEAVLQDEFSITMYKALDESGKWDELSLEAKTAFLYSNTPEVMAETMLKLGLWDEYQPEIKDLDAKNYNFLNTIKDSEEKMKNWDEIPDTTKELYADNYDLLTKIYASDEMYGRFKELPDSEKKFFGENEDLLLKILNSETSWKGWQELPDSQKNILLNNEDLMTKVFASKESLSAWQALPDPVKHMLGNNEDILAKVQDGTISVEDYNQNVLPALKKLFGDNSDIIQKLTQGESGLNTYNGNNPAKKILNGDSSSAQLAAKTGGTALDIFARNNPKGKILNAQDNASTNAYNATREVQNFLNLPRSITTTLTVKRAGAAIGGAAATFAANGTNFHKGGDMIVNDQPGPLYKEIVHEPGEEPYIPVGRNVLIPNAKRGTKVYKASRTKSIMRRLGIPKYADGVGIPEDSKLVQNLRSIDTDSNKNNNKVIVQNNNSGLENKLDVMISLLDKLVKKPNVLKAILDVDEVSAVTDKHLGKNFTKLNYTKGDV